MITWVGLQRQTPFPCLFSHTKITLRKLGKSCKKTNNKTGGYQIVTTVWQELWKGQFPTIYLVYLWDFKTRKKGISKKLSDIFLKLIFFLNTHFFYYWSIGLGEDGIHLLMLFFFSLYSTNVTLVKGLVTFVFLCLTWAYQVVDFSNTEFQKTNFLEPHTVLLQQLQKN